MTTLSIYWEKIKKTKLFKIFIYFLILIVFILLMDRIVMPNYVRLGDETELPDVVDLELDEAVKLLQNQGFKVLVSDSLYDAHYKKGHIVEQMPTAYSTAKKGRQVYLTISIGERPIVMPNLFYISPRDAEFLLNSYGLELQSVFYEYDDASPEGVVIAQSYPQGQKVKAGTKISITVSLGPFPERKTVPNLIGKSLDAARRQLQILGLRNINIEYEETENILPRTVLKQSVAAGVGIEEVTSITLTVSQVKLSGER
jgi:eukaryotic-like serine/threonine-protein kinase